MSNVGPKVNATRGARVKTNGASTVAAIRLQRLGRTAAQGRDGGIENTQPRARPERDRGGEPRDVPHARREHQRGDRAAHRRAPCRRLVEQSVVDAKGRPHAEAGGDERVKPNPRDREDRERGELRVAKQRIGRRGGRLLVDAAYRGRVPRVIEPERAFQRDGPVALSAHRRLRRLVRCLGAGAGGDTNHGDQCTSTHEFLHLVTSTPDRCTRVTFGRSVVQTMGRARAARSLAPRTQRKECEFAAAARRRPVTVDASTFVLHHETRHS